MGEAAGDGFNRYVIVSNLVASSYDRQRGDCKRTFSDEDRAVGEVCARAWRGQHSGQAYVAGETVVACQADRERACRALDYADENGADGDREIGPSQDGHLDRDGVSNKGSTSIADSDNRDIVRSGWRVGGC